MAVTLPKDALQRVHLGQSFAEYSSPHQFITLLFSIGFFGLKEGKEWAFKSDSGEATFTPSITTATLVRIHTSYHAALHLREMLLSEISESINLQATGVLDEFPEGMVLQTYHDRLKFLLDHLDEIPRGKSGRLNLKISVVN